MRSLERKADFPELAKKTSLIFWLVTWSQAKIKRLKSRDSSPGQQQIELLGRSPGFSRASTKKRSLPKGKCIGTKRRCFGIAESWRDIRGSPQKTDVLTRFQLSSTLKILKIGLEEPPPPRKKKTKKQSNQGEPSPRQVADPVPKALDIFWGAEVGAFAPAHQALVVLDAPPLQVLPDFLSARSRAPAKNRVFCRVSGKQRDPKKRRRKKKG